MADKVLKLEIVTPECLFFEGEAVSVYLPGMEGEMGILANHAPILAMLNPGITRYRTSSENEVKIVTGSGFVEVVDNKAIVVVENAETAKDAKAILEKIDKANSDDNTSKVENPVRKSPELKLEKQLLEKARRQLANLQQPDAQ